MFAIGEPNCAGPLKETEEEYVCTGRTIVISREARSMLTSLFHTTASEPSKKHGIQRGNTDQWTVQFQIYERENIDRRNCVGENLAVFIRSCSSVERTNYCMLKMEEH